MIMDFDVKSGFILRKIGICFSFWDLNLNKIWENW